MRMSIYAASLALAGALALNLSVHADPRGLFEVGTVFRPQADGTVREFLSVAFAIVAEPVTRSWKSREGFDALRAKRLLQDAAALAGRTRFDVSCGWWDRCAFELAAGDLDDDGAIDLVFLGEQRTADDDAGRIASTYEYMSFFGPFD